MHFILALHIRHYEYVTFAMQILNHHTFLFANKYIRELNSIRVRHTCCSRYEMKSYHSRFFEI